MRIMEKKMETIRITFGGMENGNYTDDTGGMENKMETTIK